MDRCARCPNVNKCVPGDGPLIMGGLLFIGEAPGAQENRLGRVFVGKTGQEVDRHYLPLAGLRRERVRFTNAIKCLPPSAGGKLDSKRAADLAMLASCAHRHLYSEIAELEPQLLVPMGAFACRAIDPAIQLDLDHGRPFMTQWGIMAFPMYHPARGMHEPKKMLEIRADWIRLKSFLANTLRVPVDAYPEPDYAEVTDAAEIDCIDYTQPMACDTESSPTEGPYYLTYSTAPGTGRLIRASRTDLLQRFQQVLTRWESYVLFHNWLYDQRVVWEMGLTFPAPLIRDTMVRAYHLGCLPQGLKALAYRELGMVMQDFEDVVKPHSIPKILDYYRLAQTVDWPKPEPILERDKWGMWKVKKPQGMTTKLKRFFTDLSKNPEKDVIGMWEKNWEDQQMVMELTLGKFPGLDISHVPFDEALFYACRDADATLRLDPILDAMRVRVRDYPVDQWRIVA